MNARNYAETRQDTISQLRVLGYRYVQFVLLDSGNPYQATVELKPLKNRESTLDTISLHSEEIHEYMDGLSRMARYVISEEYLVVDG